MITCAKLNSECMGRHKDITTILSHALTYIHSVSVILSINNKHLMLQVHCGSML